MASAINKISANREFVNHSFNSAKAENLLRFLDSDDKATAEYIFPNQITDATNVVYEFYKHNRRVISIQKKTKVGADGLMIQIATLLATHNNDGFVVDPANVRIITGMSNAGWEKDMIDKAPTCFKNKIFHHGKLSRSELMNIRNGLIIIDEIDTGDKEYQVLHNTLKEAGVLDVKHMEENNNRFVFISATMIKELYDLYRWGDLHQLYTMTIPPSYIGHKDFLDMEIVKEFYAVNTNEAAEKWIQEDIIDHYADPCMCTKCNPEQNPEKKDFRVHLVRLTSKNVNIVQNACIRKGITFRNHTSTDRLSDADIKEFFKDPLIQHIVLGVKGFFRRANLIPNRWKLRIGATLELYTKIVDNNVQIQGLVGRMTGYWRDDIEAGHKTGPHRTSIKAIEEYEKTYLDPFGKNSYQTSGFKKKKGKVSAEPTMLSSKNIANLNTVELPEIDLHSEYDITEPYAEYEQLSDYIKSIIKTGKITTYRMTDATPYHLFPQCFNDYKVYDRMKEKGAYEEMDRRPIIHYRGDIIPLYDYEHSAQFKKQDIYAGMNKEITANSIVCRIMPIMYHDSIHWIGIYLKSAL